MRRTSAKRNPKPRRTISARESALGVVARSVVSETELRMKLGRKGFAKHEVDDAAELVRSYRYVDDQALSESIVREAARTGHGPLWVRTILAKRGVEEALVAHAERTAAATAVADAQNVINLRFGESLSAADRRRALRFLLSRGFSDEIVMTVLGEEL